MVRIILNCSCSPPQGKTAVFFKTGFDLPAAVCYHQKAISGYDGIGRHARFRFSCRKTCRFDPCYPHHVRRSKHRSVSALRRKLHYVSSFFLSESNPLRWASIRVFKVISRRKRRPIDRWCCFSFPNRTHFIGLRFGSHQGANTVPFPPHGENCTMLAPSSFSESNPLRWASIGFLFRAVGEKEILWNAFGNTPGNGSIRSGSRDMFNRLIWHRMH